MTDEELMVAYREGDLSAFQKLYKRHKGRLMGYLVTKLKDLDEAEDVFQSVFIKLHGSRFNYKENIPFLPWIFTITRNTMIDHIRKKRTYKKHISVDTEYISSRAVGNISEPLSIGAAISELSSLSDPQRQALELRFNDGLSFVDIGKQMKITHSNARQITSRAIRSLRDIFASKGDGK
ncbi:MAG: sigma-70 family RNA polymerase sigma factor [Desulfobacterium sp.]|jgi:RNA polymerase sigma-70 factor (ECF subfamily)|nr:sigma-70 family RNA polymerase sigma factor [Desulfobacterium sp.]